MIYPRLEKLAIAAALTMLPGCWFMMPEKATWTSAPSVAAKSYDGSKTFVQQLGIEGGGKRLVILDGGYLDQAKALARVEGFDRSAEVVLIPDSERKGGHLLFVPITTTEPRTKVFQVASDPGNSSRLVSATELRELARVSSWTGGWNGHVVAVRAPNTTEPDLYVPVQDDGKLVTLPPGVVGVRPISRDAKGKDWFGWFVRWQDGWSMTGHDHADERLSNVRSDGTHWTTATVKMVSKRGFTDEVYVAGTLPDGQCEAFTLPASTYRGEAHKRATCDQAVDALDQAMRSYFVQRGIEEAKNRPASSSPLPKEPTAAEKEAARIVAVEKAAFAEYMKAVAIPDYTASCGQALRMREKTHAELLDWRFKSVQVHGDEFFCYRARKDARSDNTQRFEARWQEQGRAAAMEKEFELRARLNRHTYTPGQGTGGPSAAERLKQSNDYTYGSGKASSCPFTDRSLCN